MCSFLKHTDFSVVEFAVYFIAQLTGAVIAAFKATYIWHTTAGGVSSNMKGIPMVLAGNITHPMENHILGANFTNVSATEGGLLSVGVAELVYTAVLVFVVLNVATCGDEGKGMKNSYFGLAIGFVLAASVAAIGSISMSCINPAVAFAVAVTDMAVGNLPTQGYQKSWPALIFLYYSLMEFLGAILAVIFFFICRRHQVGKGDKVGKPDMIARFVSEFTGTFVLCLTVMLVCHAPASNNAALGIASSLMVMIYALGNVSGANFNPAVSMGIAVVKLITDSKNISSAVIDFFVYLLAQLLAAVIALLGAVLILHDKVRTTLVGKEIDDATTLPAAKGAWMAVMTAEGVFTFILVFTVLNSAVRQAPNQFYGLAIGFVIVAGAFSLGSISGAAFNPAVALMLDFGGVINKNHYHAGFGFVYAAMELFAGVLAALFYLCVSAGKDDAGDKLDQVYDDLEEGDEEDYDYEE